MNNLFFREQAYHASQLLGQSRLPKLQGFIVRNFITISQNVFDSGEKIIIGSLFIQLNYLIVIRGNKSLMISACLEINKYRTHKKASQDCIEYFVLLPKSDLALGGKKEMIQQILWKCKMSNENQNNGIIPNFCNPCLIVVPWTLYVVMKAIIYFEN